MGDNVTEQSTPALPKAAADLIALAKAHGWLTLEQHGKDSGDAPYVTVEIGIRKPFHHYRITWHTRDTGTYRLFSKIYRTDRRDWSDAPSIKAIRAVVESVAVEQADTPAKAA